MIFKFLESLVVGASIAAIPGPIFFELVRRTLTKGLRQGIWLVLGEFTGNFLLLLIIFFGAAQFLTDHTLKRLFYIIGGSILLWVSVSAFRLKIDSVDASYKEKVTDKGRLAYLTGFSIAVTSPIVIALWVSLSGSYLNKLDSHILAFVNILLIALGFMCFFIPMAYVIHKTRHKIPPSKVVILSRAFGVVLAVYGIALLRGALTK